MSRPDPAARWRDAEDAPADGDLPKDAPGPASPADPGDGGPDASVRSAAEPQRGTEARGLHGVPGTAGNATGNASGSAAGTSTGDATGTSAAATAAGTAAGAGAILTDVAALTAERDDYLQSLQRLKADFDNYRKRVTRLQEEQAARAAAALVQKLLPVLDNLDLAVAHLVHDEPATEDARALAQARDQLLDVLGKEGLERVDATEVPFDPTVHDAVAHTAATPEADGPSAATEGAGASQPVAPATAGREAAGSESSPADEREGSAAPATPAASAAPAAGEAAPASHHEVVVDGVMRAGYRWRGQVVRPAMVRVRG